MPSDIRGTLEPSGNATSSDPSGSVFTAMKFNSGIESGKVKDEAVPTKILESDSGLEFEGTPYSDNLTGDVRGSISESE